MWNRFLRDVTQRLYKVKASAVKIYTSAKLSQHNTCEQSVHSVDLRLWFLEQFLELLLSQPASLDVIGKFFKL